MDPVQIYDRLCRLLPGQFAEVIQRSGFPTQYLKREAEPAIQTGQLVDWARQSDSNAQRLHMALNAVNPSTPAAPSKELSGFSLLFDRHPQEEQVKTLISGVFTGGNRLAIILLPGPECESHADFFARFRKFRLRKVCVDHALTDVIVEKSRPWPDPGPNQASRITKLMSDLADLMPPQNRPNDINEATMRSSIPDWIAKEQTHRIITYQVYSHRLCRSDAQLIVDWVDFLSRLDISATNGSLTVFIAVHTPAISLARLFGRSAKCVKRARDQFKSFDNVVIVDRLLAPARADVQPWVNETIDEAWELVVARGQRGSGTAPDLPLNYGELQEAAEKAFGLLGSRKSFKKLKPRLEAAIAHAYNVYLEKGTGR